MDQPITLETLVRFLVGAPLFEGLDAQRLAVREAGGESAVEPA